MYTRPSIHWTWMDYVANEMRITSDDDGYVDL